MKVSENPLIQNFTTSLNLEHVQQIVQLCRDEPWNLAQHQSFINHAVRWAVDKPNTYEFISLLLPHSDQARDCRTLFKQACAHGRTDVVRLLWDQTDGDVLRHNEGHALLLAAKSANPEMLQLLKDKTVGMSLPIDILFKKAAGVPGPAFRSLDYLFPMVTSNIHHDLLYRCARHNRVDNLSLLIDRLKEKVTPSSGFVLKIKLKEAANMAATEGHMDCMKMLIDTYQVWFDKEIDFIGLATHAWQHEQSAILLYLAQRSEDVQNFVRRAAQTPDDECIQGVLAWIQRQRLTQETHEIVAPARKRKV